MSQIVHPKKFQSNVHLFKELEQIKQLHEKQDDEEDEEDKKENNADVQMESAAPKNYKTSL